METVLLVSVHFLMAALPESAMYTFPTASTATAFGNVNPDPTSVLSKLFAAVHFLMVLLFRSAI